MSQDREGETPGAIRVSDYTYRKAEALKEEMGLPSLGSAMLVYITSSPHDPEVEGAEESCPERA